MSSTNPTDVNDLASQLRREGNGLVAGAVATLLYLGAILCMSLALSAWLLFGTAGEDGLIVVLCIVAGIAGSAGAALLSAAERMAEGWEFSSGGQWPYKKERKERFSWRMTPLFVVRPLLGGLMGFITYVSIVGGYFLAVSSPQEAALRPAGMAFFAVLAGLFAKTFLGKLKDVFATLTGAQKPQDPNQETKGAAS